MLNINNTIQTKKGSCKVIKKLGSGGTGIVFQCICKNQHYAIKSIELSGNPVDRAPLEEIRQEIEKELNREIDTMSKASKLQHKNLIKLYEAGYDSDNDGYIFMEFVEGKSLQEIVESFVTEFPKYTQKTTRNISEHTTLIRQDKQESNIPKMNSQSSISNIQKNNSKTPFSNQQLIRYLIQAAEALFAIHQEKIIHRDIKPGNIMIDNKDNIKILDFSIAKFINADHLSGTLNQIRGSIGFMSPEQMEAKKDIFYSTDIYGLGCTFYWAITGKTLFQDYLTETTRKKCKEEYRNEAPIRQEARAYIESAKKVQYSLESAKYTLEFFNTIDSNIKDILWKMLDPDAKKRYQDTQSLLSDLRKLES